MDLQFRADARFKELNSTDLPSDQFTFHLNQLVKQQLIEKNDLGRYLLTPMGKEFANRFDSESGTYEKQSKICVVVVPFQHKNDVPEVLIQQRLKHPFFNYHGFISGKTRWGETLTESAQRELIEESRLTGELELSSIEHKMDYTPDGKLLDDKLFYIFTSHNLRGQLAATFEGGKNFWYPVDQVSELNPLFDDVKIMLKMLENPHLNFWEKKYFVKGF